MTETRKSPRYYGMRKYVDKEGGYAVWLSSDWYQFDMTGDHHGWIFSPYPDDLDTCFACEKKVLDYKVTPEDFEILKKGFEEGINTLPEVEILEKKYDTGKMIVILEAKFTFMENGNRRKRWIKNMYWQEANLILMAQGKTEEDYAYWEGMLFNAMHTYELGGG